VAKLPEQARTAARPSRLSTAFPFDYPEAKSLRTCSQVISFSKSASTNSLSYHPEFFKQKVFFLLKIFGMV